MSKRKYRCRWCSYFVPSECRADVGDCSLNPIWIRIDDPEFHRCSQHKWNSKANSEILKEIVEEW